MNIRSLKQLARRLVGGLLALSPNCRETVRLQSEALDHELPPLKHLGLRIHLLLCRGCRCYEEQIRFLRTAVRAQPDIVNESAPGTLSHAARKRARRALRDRVK